MAVPMAKSHNHKIPTLINYAGYTQTHTLTKYCTWHFQAINYEQWTSELFFKFFS